MVCTVDNIVEEDELCNAESFENDYSSGILKETAGTHRW